MRLRSGVAMTVVWASATAPIGPPAWAPPYATGAALKKKKEEEEDRGKRNHTRKEAAVDAQRPQPIGQSC